MSAEAAVALYKRISSDEQFRARFEAAATPEEKRRIVSEAGYDVSRDDLPAIRELAGVSELSDEDLDKVAAAGTATAVGLAGGAVGGVAIGVAAAAALAL